MLCIPKIDDYLKILPDDEVKDFVVINFSEYFKSTREKFCFKLSGGQNLRIVAESLNLMQSKPSDNCVHRYNIEILNLFGPEVQLINTKTMIKS